MKDLTKRQQEALDFIVECIQEDGYPPTIREIGERMGISSTNGVSDHLRALERKGYLIRDESKSRALRPVHMPEPLSEDDVRKIPVLGQIAAGAPITAFEEADEQIALDVDLLGRSADVDIFALRVRGESMIEDGILDDDIIFVRRQNTARKNDIVVALIEDEATCKRYLPLGDEIHFVPANSSMEPIVVKRSDFKDTQLLGVVVGVYRRLV